ncbi:MAG: DUF5678 domain-containing protein [bacterium]|nr:DUF5678 domain-containing protein [bacterium]
MVKDWTKIYEKYKGLWIALLDDEKTVVGSGKTVRKAIEQAQEKGYKTPIMVRMPTAILPSRGYAEYWGLGL